MAAPLFHEFILCSAARHGTSNLFLERWAMAHGGEKKGGKKVRCNRIESKKKEEGGRRDYVMEEKESRLLGETGVVAVRGREEVSSCSAASEISSAWEGRGEA
jgi:hypothetical protein